MQACASIVMQCMSAAVIVKRTVTIWGSHGSKCHLCGEGSVRSHDHRSFLKFCHNVGFGYGGQKTCKMWKVNGPNVIGSGVDSQVRNRSSYLLVNALLRNLVDFSDRARRELWYNHSKCQKSMNGKIDAGHGLPWQLLD